MLEPLQFPTAAVASHSDATRDRSERPPKQRNYAGQGNRGDSGTRLVCTGKVGVRDSRRHMAYETRHERQPSQAFYRTSNYFNLSGSPPKTLTPLPVHSAAAQQIMSTAAAIRSPLFHRSDIAFDMLDSSGVTLPESFALPVETKEGVIRSRSATR